MDLEGQPAQPSTARELRGDGGEGFTARRRVPGAAGPEQPTAPRSRASSWDGRQSGTALENHIPTHLKHRGERQTPPEPLNGKRHADKDETAYQRLGGGGPQKDHKYRKRGRGDVRKGCGEEGRRRRR